MNVLQALQIDDRILSGTFEILQAHPEKLLSGDRYFLLRISGKLGLKFVDPDILGQEQIGQEVVAHRPKGRIGGDFFIPDQRKQQIGLEMRIFR